MNISKKYIENKDKELIEENKSSIEKKESSPSPSPLPIENEADKPSPIDNKVDKSSTIDNKVDKSSTINLINEKTSEISKDTINNIINESSDTSKENNKNISIISLEDVSAPSVIIDDIKIISPPKKRARTKIVYLLY